MEEEIDDSSHCPICFEPYEDIGDHLPRLLPCTHTLCHTCVGELITRSTLVCPQDRQGHPALQGARSFPQNKYILNNLKRQKEKGELFEICKRHKKKMFFYCKDCKVVICPVCIQQKHQKHKIIDFFREKPLTEKLNAYRNELLAAKQEIDKDCKDNIIRLRKRKEDLFKILDDKIIHATRSIDTLDDMKEKGDGTKTAKETLSNIQVLENIKAKMAEELKSPLQFTTYGISEIETWIHLSGEKEGVVDKLRRYCWKGISIDRILFSELGIFNYNKNIKVFSHHNPKYFKN